MESQHFSVANLQLIHRLCVIGEKLAVMIEVLRRGGDLRFGLHRFFKQADRAVWGNLEGEEIGVIVGGRRYS